MKKQKNPLCKEYKDFVAHQTQWGPGTRLSAGRMLDSWGHKSFNDLTPKWFRERLVKLSPATAKKELTYIHLMMKYFGNDLEPWSRDRIKIRKTGESVTAEDLYTKEELAAIFRACNHTRDRALFEVLYESAVRASELLTMTFNRVDFHDDGTAHITVDGKTGMRKILIHPSVPALKAWMDVHPYGGGPIWTGLRRNKKGMYEPIKYSSLYILAHRLIRQLGLKRDSEPKRLVHMFRHTRATELVKHGVRGQSLIKFMGWSKKSNMEATYVHLTTEDVDNDLRGKVFGMDVEQERVMPILQITKCLKCGTSCDPAGNICQRCGAPTSKEALAELIQKDQTQTTVDDAVLNQLIAKAIDNKLKAFDYDGKMAAFESRNQELLAELKKLKKKKKR